VGAGRGARSRFPRQDFVDATRAIQGIGELHTIAHGGNITQPWALLQFSAQLAGDGQTSSIIEHDKEARLGADDQTGGSNMSRHPLYFTR
jgi:hypothetical protein